MGLPLPRLTIYSGREIAEWTCAWSFSSLLKKASERAFVSTARNYFSPKANKKRYSLSLRSSEWRAETVFQQAVRGKTLGVVGFGKIGRLVCRKAKAFGLNVVVYDGHSEVNPHGE